MKKISTDTWIQLLGMVGVLGGLIFVGLEMQQNQRIALAAQQQARTEVFTDMMNSLTELGVNYHKLAYTPEEKTEKEITARMNFAHSMLWVFENDFLQYRLGLVDETLWQSKLDIMVTNFSSCTGKAAFNLRKLGLDKKFVEFMEEALPENCLDDSELQDIFGIVD